MLLPLLPGAEIIISLLSTLLALKPLCGCHPCEPEDMTVMEEGYNKLRELAIQLAARLRDDLDLTPEQELETCDWVLYMNLRHLHLLRPDFLTYIEHRLVLVEGAQMTMEEGIAHLIELVTNFAPEDAGWTVTWEDHVKPEERRLSNAVVRNDASRAAEQWEDEQSALTWAETIHADNT